MKRQRREFTQADKIAIRGRATDGAGRVFCEKCGIWIKSRKGYEFHHLIPEGMRPLADLQRKLTPEDGALWCIQCHGEETPHDAANIAEAKRRERKLPLVAVGKSEIARRYQSS